MKILLLDTQETKEHLELLIDIFKLEWTLFVPENIEEARLIYNINAIDILIIDFINAENKSFLEKVVKQNSAQRTITVGDILDCSSALGCENCIENYSRKRIVQPIDTKELYHTISQFDNIECKYFLSFDDINKHLPKIIKKYNFCSYNDKNRVIECEEHHVYKLFEIKEFLLKSNISHTLRENKLFIH
jgi:hypothetical protein